MAAKNTKTLAFFASMAAILAAFILLSVYDQPPRLPADADHRKISIESSCADCHGDAAGKPLNRHHTMRRSCLKCHKPR